MRQVGRLGALALATLLAFVGCDGSGATPSASSSTEQAKVKGNVSRKGKPVAKVEVKFNAANINRKSAPTATGVTGADGSYEVTTLVGENSVSLGGAATAKDPKLAFFNRSVTVKSGENPPIDIDVP